MSPCYVVTTLYKMQFASIQTKVCSNLLIWFVLLAKVRLLNKVTSLSSKTYQISAKSTFLILFGSIRDNGYGWHIDISLLYWMFLCLDPRPNKTFMMIHHLLKQPPQSTKHFLRCLRTVHFRPSWSLQVRPAVAERRMDNMMTSSNSHPAPLLGSSMGRWSAMSCTITESSLLSFFTLATSSALKSGLAALVQRTIWNEFYILFI